VSSQATKVFSIGEIALTAVLCACASATSAQYPGQVTKSKDSQELRSIAVLEWTGDEQHPKASRIIPITVFDGQQLQDGSVYMAHPEPLALEGEVEYLLKQNGKNTGLYVIQNAAMEQGSWVGYGSWKPLPTPKTVTPPIALTDDEDVASDQPVLHRKAHADEKPSGSGSSSGSKSGSGSQGPPPDPDRPTLHHPADSGSGDASSGSGSGSAPDPDRPTLHKNPTDASSGGASSGTDPDRPKLQKKNDEDGGTVSSLPEVADPNRPRLVRGKSTDSGPGMTPTQVPTLAGLPPDMQQAVAVSDSRDTPEHIWSFSWANPEDQAKYKAQLEDLARNALGLNPPPAPAKPPVKKATGTAHGTVQKTQLTLPPQPEPLVDEQFRVLELAYGSGATIVLSARTAGTGAQEKFVTLVAQPDLYGNLVVLIKNVTDGAHLDDKPRMRLVDAVDAMADNRGELLFELRGATQRQFALYRVLRGQATKVFVSGGNALAAMNE